MIGSKFLRCLNTGILFEFCSAYITILSYSFVLHCPDKVLHGAKEEKNFPHKI
jgi:hypothetical protein